ncbi:MAG: hypothetical protein JRH01_15895 [Deltaproteobacteria bacterium]|nr:hypothetical protein [Deltaproteobacteria bacterium]MBW2396023.1 hypothetical protein [Deltaproteobacteria bacterium]
MSLSAEGLARSRADEQDPSQPMGSNATDSDGSSSDSTSSELTEDELREVDELSRRDREVRAHEAAHKAAAGSLARGGASFTYENGPDGRRYAVGGEVSIDASPVGDDPAATARKMERVRAAALAPADPSGQDRQVAATAANQARQARVAAAREAMGQAGDAPGATIGREETEEAAVSGACPFAATAPTGPSNTAARSTSAPERACCTWRKES